MKRPDGPAGFLSSEQLPVHTQLLRPGRSAALLSVNPTLGYLRTLKIRLGSKSPAATVLKVTKEKSLLNSAFSQLQSGLYNNFIIYMKIQGLIEKISKYFTEFQRCLKGFQMISTGAMVDKSIKLSWDDLKYQETTFFDELENGRFCTVAVSCFVSPQIQM